jgi:protein translocase SecG subunit
MNFIVGILTFVIVLNALLLILLVLVQLPKKDAGAGMAFGAGTADALFGAGSGNALTKITKYATVAFLLLALFLGYLHDKVHNESSLDDPDKYAKQVDQKLMQTSVVAPTPAVQPAPVITPSSQPPSNVLSTLPVQTNVPAAK